MKKIFSFVGALFLGSAAFAQVSKTDSTNKTTSRKVLVNDVKDLPEEASPEAKTGHMKGGVVRKGTAENHVIKGRNKDLNQKEANAVITQKMGGKEPAVETESNSQKSEMNHLKIPLKKN